MNVKQPLLKNARIVSIFFAFFILLTTTAAVAASVTIRWDSNDPVPEGYRVFARKSGQAYNYSQPAWEGNTASCTVDNLEDRADYYLVVRAYDNGLESADSNEVHFSDSTSASSSTANTSTSTATPTVSQGNLALNRPAYASSVQKSGLEAVRVVDDSSTTRWSSVSSNDQWIYVDLGAVRTIDGVTLNWETAYGAQYAIQVSDNAVYWTTVYTEYSGNGGIDDIIFPATEARYVRMQGIQRGTGWGYSLFEFEVYGESSTTANTSTPTVSHTADTTPPSWNGATGGIGAAEDNGTSGSVTVEFDTARDVVDGANLIFNVYYAASGSWNNADWTSNSVVVDAAVSAGSIFSHAVTVSDLIDGVRYTIGVRVEDQSGNEDANTSTSTATPNDPHTTANTSTSTAAPNTSTSTATPTVSQGNLALNRPAYASSVQKSGLEAVRVVDDSSTTRWSSVASNDQWIYVDLGAVRTIDGVTLNWETAYGAQYAIQVSDNAVYWTTVYTEYSGNGGIDDIIFPATEARYVRMQGIQRGTGWGYSLFEFEVYGESSTTANTSTPTATPNDPHTTANTSTSTATPTVSQGNLALNRPAYASSVQKSGLEAVRVVDDSPTTRWSSVASNDQWIYVDLGAVRTIDGVTLNWETAYGAQYAIQVSDNAVYWTTVYTEYSGNGGIDDIIFPATEARFVRMQGIQRGTGWGYSLFEFEVYGAN